MSEGTGFTGVSRRTHYARSAGVLLLGIPLLLALAATTLPQYDARPGQFIPWYPNIVAAGNGYLLSLVLLLLLALVLIGLGFILVRRPGGSGVGASGPAAAGLFVSAAGFVIAAVAGLPVWFWARQASSGGSTMLHAAQKSEAWASFSQTMILMVGLGGLLIGMVLLAVAAGRERWMPGPVFWSAVVASGVILVAGLAMTFFWLALGGPPLVWTVSLGVTLLVRGRFA